MRTVSKASLMASSTSLDQSMGSIGFQMNYWSTIVNLVPADRPWLYQSAYREQDNAVDSNAVVVVVEVQGEPFIGYVRRKHAFVIASLMDKGIIPDPFKDIHVSNGSLQSVRKHKVCKVGFRLGKHSTSIALYLSSPYMPLKRKSIEGECAMDAPQVIDKVLCEMQRDEKDLEYDNRYLHELRIVIGNVCSMYKHLLEEEEIRRMNMFLSLDAPSARLMARLLMRRHVWVDPSSLEYFEVENVLNAIKPLVGSFLVEAESVLGNAESRKEDLRDLLNSVSVEYLKELCKAFGVRKMQRKDLIVEELIKLFFETRSVFSTNLWTMKKIRNKVSDVLQMGNWVMIDPIVFHTFELSHRLFCNDFVSIQVPKPNILSMLGVHRYVPYKCSFEPQQSLFEDRETLDQFWKLSKLLRSAYDRFELKEYSECAEMALHLFSFEGMTEKAVECSFSSRNSSFCLLLEFGNLLVKTLMKLKRYEEAFVHQQELLLMDERYGKILWESRGKWWERLVLITESHLKQSETALSLCQNALQDEALTAGAYEAIRMRTIRLTKRVNGNRAEIPELTQLHCIKTIHIEGRPINCRTGEKSRFFSFEGSVVSVEELAIEHYVNKEKWQFIYHCEGSILLMVHSLLLWDILWMEIPQVFQNPFQTAPLDLRSRFFYDSRADRIENTIKGLDDWKSTKARVLQVFQTYKGYQCVGVQWDRWSLDELISFMECLGTVRLGHLLRLLSKAYAQWVRGLPDLVMWSKGEHFNGVKFVEVKGPNDRLMPHQKTWIYKMHEFGIEVEVCKVSKVE